MSISERSQSEKAMMFWKRHNYGDSKKIRVVRSLGEGETNRQSTEIFSIVKLF